MNAIGKTLTASITFQNKLFLNDAFTIETNIPITATADEYLEYQTSPQFMQHVMEELPYTRKSI